MTDVLPVGIPEIAEKLGVKRATVDQWIQRGLLPPPDWTVGGRPAWNWPTVRGWAVETGRLQEEAMLTVIDLTRELGLPATAADKVARFVGAFEIHDPRTGRLPKRWAGLGMDATFTRDEAEDLIDQWHRSAASAEGLACLLPGDPDAKAISSRYRP